MKIHSRLATLAIAAGALFTAPSFAAPFTIKIIGFNDYHGNLESPGTFGVNTAIPSSQRPPVGGAEFLAAHVAALKARNPLNVVVGAGDFIGASPLISALFNDEPAVETLNKIGLEFNAVGNHEFDKGKAELLRLQQGGCKTLPGGGVDPNSCKGYGSAAPGRFDGAKFRWLSANVVETATGRTLLPPYGIKTFNGVRVAFIGMTLTATPTIVTPTGVAGLEFRDEADTVNALIPRLRSLGVEAIVVLVHQGGFASSPNIGDINSCNGDLKNADNSPSEIARIVARLDNAVDLVISGHTHAAYNCSKNTVDATGTAAPNSTTPGTAFYNPRPTGLPNASGRLVPVTSASAFGRILTDIDVTIDPATRDIIDVSPVNRLVVRNDANVPAHAATLAVVNAYNNAVSPIKNVVIGSITQALPNSADAAGNNPNGQMIADAQLAATKPVGFGEAVVAFMNPGGVRADFTFPSSTAGEGDGNVTYGEAFTVQPFGNSLVTLTLTAQDIKNVLEQQFSGCLGQTATRIMHPSAGFKYSYTAAAACGSRVTEVRLVDPVTGATTDTLVTGGVVQDPARPYRVTVNNFMSTGGDNFTVFNNGTNRLGGAQDIDALVAYLANFNATASPARPAYNPAATALQKPRITRN